MGMETLVRRLRLARRRFSGERGGNVALIFGLSLVPIFGLVGAAVDYSRASAARSAMQAALDATAVIMSSEIKKNPNLSDAEVQTKATDYFDRQWNGMRTGTLRQDASATLTRAVHAITNGRHSIDMAAQGSVNTMIIRAVAYLPNSGMSAFNRMDYASRAKIEWGANKLRVALALDTTGSMADDNKIQALRTAVAGTNGLIDQLSAINVNTGDVYVSIIPFAMNVSTDPLNASHREWFDFTDWGAEPPVASRPGANVGPGSACPWNGNPFGCTGGPANVPNCFPRMGINSGCVASVPASGKICPSLPYFASYDRRNWRYYNGCYDSQEASSSVCTGSSCSCSSGTYCSCTGSGSSKTCTTKTFTHAWRVNSETDATTRWNGCITDRGPTAAPGTTSGYDQRIDQPGADATTLFPADQYWTAVPHTTTPAAPPCPDPMRALNNDWSAMKTYVQNLSVKGGTNQNIGLVWAWQSLVGVPQLLPAPAKDPNLRYDDYIILLSDGLNTGDRWYCDGTTGSPACASIGTINSRMAETCQNIKNSGTPGNPAPMIYTVQVNTGNPADPLSTVLRNCASFPNDTAGHRATFYQLTQSGQIPTTFNLIAHEIIQTYISQ